MNEMITVIVAVFNAEQVLQKCIDSILCQSYPYFELILVNDGSTDFSASIMTDNAKNDSRIKVLHQKNQGVSGARNAGIQAALYDKLVFIDADDYIDNRYLEALMHVDPSFFPVVAYFIDVKKKDKESSKSIVFSNHHVDIVALNRIDELYRSGFLCSIWNKLYDKKIIKAFDISFKEDLSLAEDAIFNAQYIRFSKKAFCIINQPSYHYIKRDCFSLDNKYNPFFFDAQLLMFHEIKETARSMKASSNVMMNLNHFEFNALMVSFDNLYKGKNRLNLDEFQSKWQDLKSRRELDESIQLCSGKYAFMDKIRYCCLKKGLFFIDFYFREFIKQILNYQ